MKVTVKTSSRLHLGFMDLNGDLGRLYGSIGVSLSNPRTEISVKPHSHLAVQNADRGKKRKIFDLVKAFSNHYQIEPNVMIRVYKTIPEHKGLGSGTQLALSVSTALALAYGIKTHAHDLSILTGRGRRSSIGIASFERGGFIIDSGKKRRKEGDVCAEVPKAVVRYDFPKEWNFVIVIPEKKEGLSGKEEKEAMRFICPSKTISEEICRLVMMKLLPSFLEKDIEQFGSALTDIDRKTGMFFEPVQRGIYCEKMSYKIIDHMLASGAYGAGQSSWGPALYGLTLKQESDSVANSMRAFLERHKIKGNVIVSSARNKGADVEVLKGETQERLNIAAVQFSYSEADGL